MIEALFHYVADTSIEFTRKNCKFPCPGTGAYVVSHIIKYIDCYMKPYKPLGGDAEEVEIPKDIDDRLINSLIYATIWGIGGCIEESTRAKFDLFLKELISGEDVIINHALDLGEDKQGAYEAQKINIKFPDVPSVFDAYFDAEEMRWTPWLSTVPKYEIDKEQSYLQLTIPTTDSIRINNIAITLLKNNKHCMLVGPTGTGKSVQINNMLKAEFDNQEWSNYVLGFSA
jgi:dynein heavy chain